MDQVLSKSDTRFSISNDGFTRMNSGRPCKELVREAVSNAFDADGVTEVRVTLRPGLAIVEDNAPSGVQDHNLVTTIFMTEKNESCKKRGRKGRGLKELVSAAEHAEVDTSRFKIVFDEGHTVLTSDRAVGTKVSVYVDSWKEDSIDEAVAHLSKIIPPLGVSLFINDVEVKRPPLAHTFNEYLETQVITNGVQKDVHENTAVNLHLASDGEGWVYEMGVPVDKSNCPWHIDVQQRIPLSDTRNSITYYYMSAMYGKILSNLIDKIDKRYLSNAEWVGRGLECVYDDTVHEKYVEKVFGTNTHNIAIASTNSAANAIARSHGYKLVDTSALPTSVVASLKKSVASATAIAEHLDKHSVECVTPADADPTGQVTRFVQYLSTKILKVHLSVEFFSKEENYAGKLQQARIDVDKHIICLNTKANLGLATPLNSRLMSVLCAQFAKYLNTNDEALLHDTNEIAGQMAVIMLQDRDKITALLSNTHAQATTRKIIIKCCDCGSPREIDEWNKAQVTRCVPCAKRARNKRRT